MAAEKKQPQQYNYCYDCRPPMTDASSMLGTVMRTCHSCGSVLKVLRWIGPSMVKVSHPKAQPIMVWAGTPVFIASMKDVFSIEKPRLIAVRSPINETGALAKATVEAVKIFKVSPDKLDVRQKRLK